MGVGITATSLMGKREKCREFPPENWIWKFRIENIENWEMAPDFSQKGDGYEYNGLLSQEVACIYSSLCGLPVSKWFIGTWLMPVQVTNYIYFYKISFDS